ncbi:MAG: thiamine-binding protein [Actinomycetota bacterium]
MPDPADERAAITAARLEVFVEPFEEGQPGPHVGAVLDALRAHGVDTDLGALATTADGDLDQLVESVGDVVRAAFAEGASALQLRLERSEGAAQD